MPSSMPDIPMPVTRARAARYVASASARFPSMASRRPAYQWVSTLTNGRSYRSARRSAARACASELERSASAVGLEEDQVPEDFNGHQLVLGGQVDQLSY